MIHVLFSPPLHVSAAPTNFLRLGYSRSSRDFWREILQLPPEKRIDTLKEEIDRIFSSLKWDDLGELGIGESLNIYESLSRVEVVRVSKDVFSIARYNHKGDLSHSYGWSVGEPFPIGLTRESLLAEMTDRLILAEDDL